MDDLDTRQLPVYIPQAKAWGFDGNSVKNTRVPIKNLIDYLEAGDNLDEFLEDFPSVSRKQSVQALELVKEVLQSRAHVYPD